MIDRLLKSHLEPIARACQRWQLWRSLALCWTALALAGLAFLMVSNSKGWPTSIPFFLLLVAAVISAVVVVRGFRSQPLDYQAIARQIERENPELHTLLLTAVEQEPLAESGELNYLQQRVVLEALDRHRRSVWGQSISRRYNIALGAQWAALVLFLVTLVALRPRISISFDSGLWAGAEHSNGVIVSPGDTNLERGQGLVVMARFEGALPAGAELVINPVNEPEHRVALAKNLSDPVFGGGIPEVKDSLTYHIEYSGGKTRDFKVGVFEYPRLDHADVKITYPAYTSLPEKTIKNTRRVSAVEGSTLDYAFFLNKPVVSAKLVAKDDTALPLTVDAGNASTYHTKIILNENHSYKLVLVDDAGRTNKVPMPEFVLEALKNRPADLKIASPRGDQRVSPLQEISFAAEASGDYGLKSYGIAYTLVGGETKTVELGKDAKAKEKRQFNYVLPLESLGAQPDQLLSYYIWATDTGADGQPRTNTSDIYFAEIKPFEEIFREAQQADAGANQNNNNNNNNGQGGQRGNQRDRLTDLEKQIITATFNLKRRETDSKPSAKYKDDTQVVRDSQEQALEQVRTLKEQNDDPQKTTFIDSAEKAMTKASGELADAADKNSLAPLTPALTDEQTAYQAVLKLAAREYQVTRGQRGQRGQQARNQQQQAQLDQLDLQQQQNQYETQREATQPEQQQQNPQQREQLQVANRLKELSQRQNDLNQRIRELQASLQEARTEQQRAEIRDQLKRLTDEQQNLLADVDELRQRMDRPENQTSQTGDQQQQLDQTRNEVQNAAQALGQNNVQQALNSGTRAQQDLQQLQDQVRKQNSGAFTEDMRRMRDDARQLAQRQADLEKQLSNLADPEQRKLSETPEQRQQRTDLASQLLRQKQGVTNLLDQMRQVSEQSETAEPLLSQQLYDTIRQTGQDELDNSLDSSSEFVRRGMPQQAGPYEQRARQNIDQLKTGVEQAAESILGDGTEALRMAQRELDQANQELNAGLAQNGNGDTNAPDQQSGQGRRSGANRGGRQGQNGQPGQGVGQPDQQANADGQPGDNPQDGQQPGETGQGGRQGQGRNGQGQQANGQRPGGNRGGRQGQGQGQGQGEGQPDQQASSDGQPGDNPQDGQPGAGNGGRQGQGRNGQGRQGQFAGGGRNGQPGQRGNGQPGDGQNPGDQQPDQQANGGGNPDGQQQIAGGAGGQGTPEDQLVQRLMQRRQAELNGDTNFAGGEGTNFGGVNFADGRGARNGGNGNFNNNAGGNYGGPNNGAGLSDGAVYDGPLVNTNYIAWSDRLRNVEEMTTDVPDLSTQVAQIRDRARTMRLEYNRLGKKPDWAVVRTQISEPLAEVRARLDQELLKRESKDALVPLDRDPVPSQYSELVRRYYEQLGKSQ